MDISSIRDIATNRFSPYRFIFIVDLLSIDIELLHMESTVSILHIDMQSSASILHTTTIRDIAANIFIPYRFTLNIDLLLLIASEAK